jgi:hypothetical protein
VNSIVPKPDLLPLFERLESLEKVEDIRKVTSMLAKRAPPGTATSSPVTAVPMDTPENTLLETTWVP